MEEKIIEDPITGLKIKTYHNGDKYEGQFINGKRQGKGKYIYKNGDIYEGDFNQGLKEGKGKYIS